MPTVTERRFKVGDVIRYTTNRLPRTGWVRGICVSATDPNERTLDIAWFDNPDPPYWIGEYWLGDNKGCEVISESR